jgi:membrane protein involved in colicin uptake
MIPQIILTAILFIGLIKETYRAGIKRDKSDLIAVIIATTIIFGLLIWGGFYNQIFK